MNTEEESNTSELKDDINPELTLRDWEISLKSKLESEVEVEMQIIELTQRMGTTENPKEMEQNRTEIRKLLKIQNYKDESLSFIEFAQKYHEYKSDVINKYRNYKSDLISEGNLLYVFGLYRKYLEDTFDDFINEFRKVGDKQARKREHLIPFCEFERYLFHHAISLCYHEGEKSPTIEDVNNMILTKPYGDGSLYPQNKIWQIVGFPGDRYMKAHRDYYCDLAIKRKVLAYEKKIDLPL